MPNLDNIRLWVAALRSGEYRQGLGSLHDKVKNTWCCLGVACDVARKNGLPLIIAESDDKADVRFDGETAFLPDSVQAWLGIESCNPFFSGAVATDWNDDHQADFLEIADKIEAEYLR